MVLIVSPVPVLSGGSQSSGPAAGGLAGKRVGLRRDWWLTWDYVTDEWARMLEVDHAKPVLWRAPVAKGSDAAVEASKEYLDFLDRIDVLVTGLCNCGSCTMWAVHDGVGALDRNLPTVFTATTNFEPLTRMLAGQRGRSQVRLVLLPYPLEGRSEAEVRQIAREHYPDMLAALGAIR
jgi:hypothetical protein